MKQLFLILSLTGYLPAYSQNGGQANENSSVKIEQEGYTVTGLTVIRTYNKQDCNADIRVTYGNANGVKNIPASSSDTFCIPVPVGSKVRAKTETNCGFADFGQVELTVVSLVPIKFNYLKVTKVDSKTIEVEFKVEQIDNIRSFNLQLSLDGGPFRTVRVVLPRDLTVNHLYKTKITL